MLVFSKMSIAVGFVGSELRIFEGFGWVCSSVLNFLIIKIPALFTTYKLIY